MKKMVIKKITCKLILSGLILSMLPPVQAQNNQTNQMIPDLPTAVPVRPSSKVKILPASTQTKLNLEKNMTLIKNALGTMKRAKAFITIDFIAKGALSGAILLAVSLAAATLGIALTALTGGGVPALVAALGGAAAAGQAAIAADIAGQVGGAMILGGFAVSIAGNITVSSMNLWTGFIQTVATSVLRKEPLGYLVFPWGHIRKEIVAMKKIPEAIEIANTIDPMTLSKKDRTILTKFYKAIKGKTVRGIIHAVQETEAMDTIVNSILTQQQTIKSQLGKNALKLIRKHIWLGWEINNCKQMMSIEKNKKIITALTKKQDRKIKTLNKLYKKYPALEGIGAKPIEEFSEKINQIRMQYIKE